VLGFWLFATDSSILSSNLQYSYTDWLFLAVVSVSLALGGLWAGYMLGFRRWAHSTLPAPAVTRQFRLSRAIVLWAILWPITVLAVPLNLAGWGGTAIGAWANYLNFVQAIVGAIATALTLYHFRHPSKLGWLWLVATLAINVFNAIALGTRGAVLLFVNLFMLNYYATGKYRWTWAVAGTTALLLLAPSATRLREIIPQYQAVDATTRFSAVGEAVDATLDQPLANLVQETASLFVNRQTSLLVVTASVIQTHPAVRPFVGDQMLQIFVEGLIPRVLYRDKPAGTPSCTLSPSCIGTLPAQGSLPLGW